MTNRVKGHGTPPDEHDDSTPFITHFFAMCDGLTAEELALLAQKHGYSATLLGIIHKKRAAALEIERIERYYAHVPDAKDFDHVYDENMEPVAILKADDEVAVEYERKRFVPRGI